MGTHKTTGPVAHRPVPTIVHDGVIRSPFRLVLRPVPVRNFEQTVDLVIEYERKLTDMIAADRVREATSPG